MLPPLRRQALTQRCLGAKASDVVEIDGSGPLPKVSIGEGVGGTVIAELATHHVGILDVPGVVTDGPPRPVTCDLHATLGGTGSTNQADLNRVIRCGGVYIGGGNINIHLRKSVISLEISNLSGNQ